MNQKLLQKCKTCEFRSVDRCRRSNRPIAAMTVCPLEATGQGGGEARRSLPVFSSPRPQVSTLETARIAHEITIGITAFRRPDAVIKQLTSIRRFYPTTRILIVDNGDRLPDVSAFQNVELVQIEFDAGLSASRNELARRLQTPYLMLCDDDYVWTAETDLGKLLDVLDDDSNIGVVGGGLLEKSQRGLVNRHWGQWLVQVDDVIESRPLTGPPISTANGCRYRLTDTIMNFALFRRELLVDHEWSEELKLNEHVEYYWRVKQAARWKVAVCESVTARHERQLFDDYNAYRHRAAEFNSKAYAMMGVRDFAGMAWADPRMTQRGGSIGDRPNVIVLGIGNCGTTPVTRMAMTLGWHCPDADETYAESVELREINCGKSFDADRARRYLEWLPQPWVIKDPRLVITMENWLPLLTPYRPLLLLVSRERDSVIRSRLRRGVDRESAETWHEERDRAANRIYANWAWGRLQVDFERVCEAAAVIDPERDGRRLKKERVIDLAMYLDGTAGPEELDEVYQNAYGQKSMEITNDDPRIVWTVGHALAQGGCLMTDSSVSHGTIEKLNIARPDLLVIRS